MRRILLYAAAGGLLIAGLQFVEYQKPGGWGSSPDGVTRKGESQRQNVSGGAITFGKAFQVGILVVLVASVVYVATWEVIYYKFFPDFGDKYAAHMLEKMKSTGKSAEAIDAATKEMAKFREMYRNPLVNAGMTLMEVLPVGLLMTLVSAAALRRKEPAPSPA